MEENVGEKSEGLLGSGRDERAGEAKAHSGGRETDGYERRGPKVSLVPPKVDCRKTATRRIKEVEEEKALLEDDREAGRILGRGEGQ